MASARFSSCVVSAFRRTVISSAGPESNGVRSTTVRLKPDTTDEHSEDGWRSSSGDLRRQALAYEGCGLPSYVVSASGGP